MSIYNIPKSVTQIDQEYCKPTDYTSKLRKFFANQNSLLLQLYNEDESCFVNFMFEPSDPQELDLEMIKIFRYTVSNDSEECAEKYQLSCDYSKWEQQFSSLSDEICEWIRSMIEEHHFDIYDLFTNEFICNQDFALIYFRKDLDKLSTINEVLRIKNIVKSKYRLTDEIIRQNSGIISDVDKFFIRSTLKNCSIETLQNLQRSNKQQFIIQNLVRNYYKQPKYITNPHHLISVQGSYPNITRKESGQLYQLHYKNIPEFADTIKKCKKKAPNILLSDFQEQTILSPYTGQCFGCGSVHKLNLKYLCFSCWKILLTLYINSCCSLLLCEFSSHNQTLKFESPINIKLDSDTNVIKNDTSNDVNKI